MVRCQDEPRPDLFICVIIAGLITVTGFALALRKIDADRRVAAALERIANHAEGNQQCGPGY